MPITFEPRQTKDAITASKALATVTSTTRQIKDHLTALSLNALSSPARESNALCDKGETLHRPNHCLS